MADRRRRREIPEVEGATVERGIGPTREATQTSSPSERHDQRAAAQPSELPDPRLVENAEGPLGDDERALLTACENAIDGFRRAFISAGKALQNVRDRRLYRDDFPTFDEYCRDRWSMTRIQADRFIREWPIAQRLIPIGFKPPESQVREIVPVHDRHGMDAAVSVYRVVAETEGVTVTAQVLHNVVSLLPEEWDDAAAEKVIRAYLAGELQPPPAAARAVRAPTIPRVRENLRALTTGDLLRQAARKDPQQLRDLVDELRAALAEIESLTTD